LPSEFQVSCWKNIVRPAPIYRLRGSTRPGCLYCGNCSCTLHLVCFRGIGAVSAIALLSTPTWSNIWTGRENWAVDKFILLFIDQYLLNIFQ
jgi:hypothetical protein